MQADLAIIIPAGPGDRAWRDLLPQLAPAQAREIVLVLANDDQEAPGDLVANVRCVHSRVGRAHQLNTGANATKSDWLWFLHADSRVSTATLDALQHFVLGDERAIGYFDLRFLPDGPRLVFLNAAGAWFRSRILGLPFGDQALLMPRRVFDVLGGFDERISPGEDHALVWTARRNGVPLRALKAPIHTSARKYAEQGWWRTTGQHLRMTLTQAASFSGHKPAASAGRRP